MKRRIPLFIALGVAFLIWKTGALGFLAVERTLVWRIPVSYRDVRHLELQVWAGDELLLRQERSVEGLTAEPESKISLSRGVHRAIARVQLAAETRVFQREFDPGGEDAVVLDLN